MPDKRLEKCRKAYQEERLTKGNKGSSIIASLSPKQQKRVKALMDNLWLDQNKVQDVLDALEILYGTSEQED
jgi:hypothetical protein